MVEISISSCDDISTNELFSGGNGMSDHGAPVVKLFTRPSKDMVPLEGKTEEVPIIAPELASLLSQHKLHLEQNPPSRTDHLSCEDVTDALTPDSGTSRECLYTPVASTLPLTSPELKLREFEKELANLKAERTKHRTALREQVLAGIDIPAGLESVNPSSGMIVPRNPGTVSEHEDPYSVSSRSSEENLTFLDATDELNDDVESEKEKFEEEKKTSNSESVDFSFLHKVYRAKGKHEEAILLRMKYAGSKGSRMERSEDTGTPDTISSNSILGTAHPHETDAEIVKEYADLFREVRKYTTGVTKHRLQQETLTPEVGSASESGSTTPRQPFHRSSKGSSAPTSNRTSKTSVEVGTATAAPCRGIFLPPTQTESSFVSEHSSPSVSRPESPSFRTRDLSLRSAPSMELTSPPFDELFSNRADSHSYPIAESSQCSTYYEYPPSESSRRSTYDELPTMNSPHCITSHEYPLSELPKYSYHEYPRSESSRLSNYHEYHTSESPLQNLHHEYAAPKPPLNTSIFRDHPSESLPLPNHHEYPTSECGTEEEWPFRSDRSDRSRKKPLEIPITIDGRLVYPEVVIAEDAQAAQAPRTFGLLDRVKSFAQNCGPHVEGEEQSPVLQESCPEGRKTSVKLNAALLSRLTCVECGSLCPPPVAMCVWGHIVCEECRPVSLWESHEKCWCRNRCPQCSGDMLSQPCELWTNIARSLLYPCRFTRNGCRETGGLTSVDKLLHEQACRLRQLRCWCSGCSWRGVWHQLKAHVNRSHLATATQADWYRFVPVSGAISIGRSSDVIVLPTKELVLLHSLAVIGEHRYLLQYLNDDGGGGAVVFVPRFRLRLTSKDGKSEMEVRGEAVPGHHDVERALRSGRCFRLSGTPFGRIPFEETNPPEKVSVQLCLEKGRLSVS